MYNCCMILLITFCEVTGCAVAVGLLFEILIQLIHMMCTVKCIAVPPYCQGLEKNSLFPLTVRTKLGRSVKRYFGGINFFVQKCVFCVDWELAGQEKG